MAGTRNTQAGAKADTQAGARTNGGPDAAPKAKPGGAAAAAKSGRPAKAAGAAKAPKPSRSVPKTPARKSKAASAAEEASALRGLCSSLRTALDSALLLARLDADSPDREAGLAAAEAVLFSADALLERGEIPQPGPDAFEDDIGFEPPAAERPSSGGFEGALAAAAALTEAARARRIVGEDEEEGAKVRRIEALTTLAERLAEVLAKAAAETDGDPRGGGDAREAGGGPVPDDASGFDEGC